MSFSQSTLLKRISEDIGLQVESLVKIISTAPFRYKVYEIPKKSGGFRTVAQPAREVKAIQYWLNDELCDVLPISECALAYRKGISIKNNANVHKNSRFLLKMDFSDFFPSIKYDDVKRHLNKNCSYFSENDLKLIGLSTLWMPARKPPLRLCIGAPTSPLLSNSIMFDFDENIKNNLPNLVKYTRYADDLFFSTNEENVLDDVERLVSDVVLKLQYPVLSINRAKTVNVSRGEHRSVTGIVLKPDGGVSVGRSRKRLARAMYHRYARGLLNASEEQKMRGLLAFIEDIEPGFMRKLEK